MQPTPKKPTSVWVYIGCGCAALVVLAMASMAVMTYIAYRQGKELAEGWSDPVKRESRAKEVLPYDKLPEGYYPMGTFSIPFVLDMAMFTDDPPPAGSRPEKGKEAGGFKDRGFIYVKARKIGNKAQELEDYVAGKGKSPDWLDVKAKINEVDIIRRGEVAVNGNKVVYTASRGEVTHDNRTSNGITTMMLFGCPHRDSRIRVGIWFGPDPDPAKPPSETDFTGTNADPEEIRKFAEHFRVCG
ncbi:MAG: hypothetical protein ACJ75H_03930 [Thermoanaerobaculia bacterium]